MKRFVLLLLFACVSMPICNAQVGVRGYVNDRGRYVQPHYRSMPDSSYNNNWSTRPNVNPYTHRQGTLAPTWNDRPPQQSGFGSGFGSGFEMAPMRPSSSMMRSNPYSW